MSILKRALLSLIRNKVRTAVILVLLVINCLVLTFSTYINTVCSGVINSVEKELSPAMTISGEYTEKTVYPRQERSQSYEEYEKDVYEVIEYSNALMNDERVQYLDYSLKKRLALCNLYTEGTSSLGGEAYSISGALLYEVKYDAEHLVSLQDGKYSDGLILGTSDWGYLAERSNTLTGVSRPDFYDLKAENIKIRHGRTFTEQEIRNGENVLVISVSDNIINEEGRYAYPEVGDKVYMYSLIVDEEMVVHADLEEFTIIGIATPEADMMKQIPGSNYFAYTPNATVLRIYEREMELSEYYNCKVMSEKWKRDNVGPIYFNTIEEFHDYVCYELKKIMNRYQY